MRRLGSSWLLASAFGLVSLAGVLPVQAGEARSFILSRFSPAIYKGENSCPHGLELTPQQSFLAQQTPQERERLQRPEHAEEFAQKYKWDFGTGPNGEEMCREPRNFENQFEHPVHRMVQGTVAFGFNLDGHDGSGEPAPGTCPHENFVNPDGEPGIDNQLFRANGCLGYYRGSATDPAIEGAINAYYNRMLNEGLHGIIMEIRGIDDYEEDDHVEVGIYSTLDKPLLVNNRIMPDSSFAVAENTRWHNVARGRISGGVLETDPIHLTLNMEWAIGGEDGATQEYDMRGARFRLRFREDRSIEGVMGAYQPLDNVYSLFRSVGAGVSAVAGVDCAAEFKSLVAMADGHPDPETGQCTTISLAYEVVGQTAFIIHPEQVARTQ